MIQVRRMVNDRSKLDGVQALRGIAALLVVFHHLLEELVGGLPDSDLIKSLIRLGACGVDVFFVISGFIIAHSVKSLGGRGREAARVFALRRMARVLPLYWGLNVLVLILASTGFLFKSKVIDLPVVLASFFFLPGSSLLQGVGWTLNFEVYFYLCFAFAILVPRGVLAPVAAATVLAVNILAGALGLEGSSALFLQNRLVFEFVFGVFVATFMNRSRLLLSQRGVLVVFLLAGASMWLASSFDTGATSGLRGDTRWWAWGLPATALLAASIWWIKPHSLWVWLGDISYSLYLGHAFVMTAVAVVIKRIPSGPLWAMSIFIVGVLVSIGIAFLLNRYVEKPSNAWLIARLNLHPSGRSATAPLAMSHATP